jgi:hypothetical protein
MNRIFRILVSSSALLGALAVLPGVANAAEPDRPAPPASVDRDRDHDGGRGWDRDGRGDRDRPGYDRDWRQDRAERERIERERGEHDRACHVAWERGASPESLRAMRCY